MEILISKFLILKFSLYLDNLIFDYIPKMLSVISK